MTTEACGSTKTPKGWTCSRELGHEGPCSTWPDLDTSQEDRLAELLDSVADIRATATEKKDLSVYDLAEKMARGQEVSKAAQKEVAKELLRLGRLLDELAEEI